MQNTIITIARAYGSGGRTIGKMLSKEMDFPYYDRNLIYMASDKSGINVQRFFEQDEKIRKESGFADFIPPENRRYVSNNDIFEYQSKIIHEISDHSDCIIVGRCANFLLKNSGHKVLRVFIYAPDEVCIDTIKKKFRVSEREAEKTFKQINKHRREYYKYHTGIEWESAENYDVCFDTSRMTYEQVVSAVVQYSKIFSSL